MQNAKLGKYTAYYENSEEYHRLKREVWGANSYYVELEEADPVIIDGGAHIGLTTLYFKRLFPNSKIIAFEPFPESVEIFRKNIYENQLEGVELREEAIAEHEGIKDFFYDSSENKWFSTASLINGAWNQEQQSSKMRVKTVTLSSLLEQYQPNLVKLDIEGAEEKVIWEARDAINNCQHYLIEFHPIEGVGMERIIKVFEERRYQITVTKGGKVVPWRQAIGLSLIEAWR